MFARSTRGWSKNRIGAFVFAQSLWLGAASPVLAQTPQAQAAEALFRQAKQLMDEGDLAAACEKFAASQALDAGLGTLLYLGDCYERAGRFASALSTFAAAAELAETRADETRQRLASVRASALSPRVPTLTIQTGPAPQAIELMITVNGSPIAPSELDRARPYDAGEYEIRFSAPGYEPFVSRIELKNGRGGVVLNVPRLLPVASPGMDDPGASAPRSGADEPGGTQRVLGWVVGSTGLALLAVGGVFAGMAARANQDSKASCDPQNPNRCGPDGVRLRNDAQDYAGLATLGGLLGGLGVAGGLVLYVAAPDGERGLPEGALIGLRGTLL
jgi:hypothetical protein